MCAHDLELRVEVKSQIEEASPSSGRMTRRHGLEGVIDLFPVTRANRAVVHKIGESSSRRCRTLRDHGLADGQEVRAKAANKPLDEHLEDGGGDQTYRGVMSEIYRRFFLGHHLLLNKPILVVSQSSRLLLRIWKRVKKTKGMMKARRAASQIGIISLRRGYAN